ncbi:hypothetical protein OAC91_04935 [Candidatus Marinimicrobia bacterium]|jgi:hypothetical protein|nr:hypothetical protein [Candidatus Neomarinimicrobiota bacterium]|tara:strand:+ start:836 stop:1261 length:426 start_codon:yes stop_codon:yes gene_type:complete
MFELSLALGGIGVITLLFSIVLILFPDFILKTDENMSRLFLTDSFVIRHRIAVGVFSFMAASMMLYTYFISNMGVYFLTVGVIAFFYSIALIFFPMGLLKIERHANKIYMTDEFFYKHKNFVGGVLAFLSFYMIYVYTTLI